MQSAFKQTLKIIQWLCVVSITLSLSTVFAATLVDNCSKNDCVADVVNVNTGFLVVTPDRGYAGNQAIRAAFAALKKKHHAELVFITDARTEPYIQQALTKLRDASATRFVVLPLFMSTAHPKLSTFRTLLKKRTPHQPITIARPFGQSYFAVEMLLERLASVKWAHQKPVLLITHGANSTASLQAMQHDIKHIIKSAISDGGHKKIKWVVLPSGRTTKDYASLEKAAWKKIHQFKQEGITQVIPFHLGKALDSMMSLNARIAAKLPKGMKMIAFNDNEVAFFSLWMQREANRYLSSQETTLGIVFHAHGADFHWNQGMRDAVTGLTQKHPVEFAFSMADPKDLRQAVQRLEKRGVGVIVIVRVFGMRSSFRDRIERIIGQDIETPPLATTETPQNPHHLLSFSRLKTTALVVTEGGLEDSDLFAQAMLEKAKALSKDIANDTVLVIAHGKGTQRANQQWLDVLNSLVKKMKVHGGNQFKAIYYQTWQEDWGDKRGRRISRVLKRIKDAKDAGSNVIIIPARTTGKGRANAFLKEGNYVMGTGFAPHPLFEKWVEQQVIKGVERIKKTRQAVEF